MTPTSSASASPASARLPAAERRAAIVDAALRVFSTGSYSAATTAEIAREAGVSEPILYRHFESKRALYLVCLDVAWGRFRSAVETALERTPEPADWPLAMSQAARDFHERGVVPANLWVQALTEAGADPEIRRYLRRHVREIHAFFEQVILRAQAAGGVPADRDAAAEAWISLGVGLLRSVAHRLGGLLGREDFARIGQARSRWLSAGG
jgi:TetR/AcrR family transcriptional regulator